MSMFYRMLSSYAIGIFLVVSPFTAGPIWWLGSPSATDFIFAHFMLSVAISGSFSPQMYIHLMELQKKREFVPSGSLPSCGTVSFVVVGPEVISPLVS